MKDGRDTSCVPPDGDATNASKQQQLPDRAAWQCSSKHSILKSGVKNDNGEMKRNRDWRAGCYADGRHDVLAQQHPWKEIFEPIYQSLQYTYTGRKCTWLDKLALNDGLRKASHTDEDLTRAGKAICQRRSRAHS
jgi:hypothetical protein